MNIKFTSDLFVATHKSFFKMYNKLIIGPQRELNGLIKKNAHLQLLG